MPYTAVTKSHYKYVADDGQTYRVKLADYIAGQKDTEGTPVSIIGAVLATGTEPVLPGTAPLRRAIVRDLVGKKDRTVIICTPTAPMIAVPQPPGASTLALNQGASSATYTYQGRYLTQVRGRRA